MYNLQVFKRIYIFTEESNIYSLVVRELGFEMQLATAGSSTVQDVSLRAVDPFYPDGMMHYYVQGTPEGCVLNCLFPQVEIVSLQMFTK